MLVDRLEAAGSPVRAALRPPLPRVDVARHFEELGLHPTPELVDLFSWHDGAEGADLFWETQFQPLSEATAVWTANRTFIDDEANARRAFPGPNEWFPALLLDGSELLVIDNSHTTERGSVWFTFTQVEPERLFASFLEGVLAAVACVEQGLWQAVVDGTIECNRQGMPTAEDRSHPPWVEI